MTNRLARFHVNPLFAWVVPGLAVVVVTGYLSWGAWVAAHNPRWLTVSHVWWRADLAPRNDMTLLVALLVGLAAWVAFWWPRRVQGRFTGLIAIVAMVAVGAALGTSALAPCRGGETGTSVAAGVLGLFTGNPPTAYGSGTACPGQPPLALQLAQIICLGATLIGALAVLTTLWREPLARLRARFVKDATIFTGLDPLTMPLLQRLAETGRPSRIVVIEPDSNHPLLEDARATEGARDGGQPGGGPNSAAGHRRMARVRAQLCLRAAERPGRERGRTGHRRPDPDPPVPAARPGTATAPGGADR